MLNYCISNSNANLSLVSFDCIPTLSLHFIVYFCRSPSPVNGQKHSKTSQQLEPTKRDDQPHAPSPKRTKYDIESREAEIKRRLNDEPISSSKSNEPHYSKKSTTKSYYHEDKYRSSDEVFKYKQKSSSKHRGPGDSGKRGREEGKGGEHYSKSKSSGSKSVRNSEAVDSRRKCWLSSNLRVRIIDQQFKRGRHYNTKVRF